MAKFSSFFNKLSNVFVEMCNSLNRGYMWLGTDGIINMETSALLMIIFMLFFPLTWASILTFLIVIGKCVLDKSRGRENELHDFICAIIGIIIGIILCSALGIIFII
jgi:hypothetical protein